MIKKIAALALVTVLCAIVLCSCGEGDFVGTWTGTGYYDGVTMEKQLIINDDHTYTNFTTKNGSTSVTEGTWKAGDSSDAIVLTVYGETGYSEWVLKDGKLCGGIWALSKQ